MSTNRSGREIRKPDSQGRIVIGKDLANETFEIERQSNGDIILRSVAIIPKQEKWLFENQVALASVKRGLQQAADGQTHDLGSFAKYAEEPDDEV